MTTIVKIYGGLAGQMTQYAFARYLELMKKEPVKLDISFFGQQTLNNSFRKFELLNWNTQCCIASEKDYDNVFSEVKITDKIKFRLLKKEVVNTSYFYEKTPFCFDSDVLKANYKIYDGYWVNNEYMAQVKQLLKKEFTPRYPISVQNNEILDKIKATNAVAIHFRRGDYVNSIHDVIKPDYYKEALAHISQQVDKPYYFVFSDDMEYVKQHYDFSDRVVYVDHNKGEESYWDIFLMSKCRHNIIANSGFSYWGAWLNENDGQLVVAPSSWMRTNNQIVKNLLLPGWHII